MKYFTSGQTAWELLKNYKIGNESSHLNRILLNVECRMLNVEC